MKLPAIIILLSILFYTAELVKIPLAIGSRHNDKTMCCKVKMKCHKKNNNKPVTTCDGSNCLNCPLGNFFTCHSISNTSVPVAQHNREFVSLKANVLPGVGKEVWRPPVVA
ncbi:hypothetical protein FW778_04075 [Ginsengibacter hankyongi]|uniref:Uncharacterized protein n=1 Tax=Ginsengibacter hankyongi TaxID=2607284 RepID=A0A5J5IJJ3_9BACT|nr:hypothetical protein [Ginsengibacter hankyongi]KAA9041220.1 hypothetical protein FW778_04075 [Ginsengibacter hankyongi]